VAGKRPGRQHRRQLPAQRHDRPDDSGGAIVIWKDSRSTVYDVYAQRILATGVADPAWPLDGRQLCTGGSGKSHTTAVSDDAGGAIVTWEDVRGGSTDIYAQHILATGVVDPAWPQDGSALCAAPGRQELPNITADGAGGAIVTWGGQIGGPFAQHVLGSGHVDPGWPLDGRALCPVAEPYSYVEIVSDGAGGAIVAWQDVRSGTEDDPWENDIYAQRVHPGGKSPRLRPEVGRLRSRSNAAPESRT
jgi:hypothetical protein